MQVTTLNKIINLFLIGAFVITVIATKYAINIRSLDKTRLESITPLAASPIIVFVATLFLLPVIILLGIVVDSLTHISIRRLMNKIIDNKDITRFKGLKTLTKDYDCQRNKFNELFKQDDRYKAIACKDNNKSIAVALFFHTATKENIEWMVQHYSIYHLATSYLFVLCWTLPAIIWIFPTSFWYKLLAIAVNLLFIFALIYEAFYRCSYSYEVIYRHGLIILCGKHGEEKTLAATLSS